MALPIKTILQENAITSATHWSKKKIGVNETAICEKTRQTRQKNRQAKTQPEKLSPVSTEELENAERAIFKVIRQTACRDEINTLNKLSGN